MERQLLRVLLFQTGSCGESIVDVASFDMSRARVSF